MKIFNLLLVLGGLLLFSINGKAQQTESDSGVSLDKIEIINFHSTHRCMTCNAIEASTKYTIETYFSTQLKLGTITHQTINVDEKENYSMAEKFEAAGTSLILNVIKKGKEKQINLTDFAFLKGRDQDKFSKEFKVKIETELNKL